MEVRASPWPPGTLVYLGDGRMAPLPDRGSNTVLASPRRCLTTVTPATAHAWLQRSPEATGRPVVVLDQNGIVAGAQAARFMLLTETVAHGVLRRIDRDEGWAITTAEVFQAFRDHTEPQGGDLPAVVMSADGRVRHGADVLSELRQPTRVVILVE